MTERTGGKTLDYKLLGSTGERVVVDRSRSTAGHPIHEAGGLSEVGSAGPVRTSTPLHTAGSFEFDDTGDVKEDKTAAGLPLVTERNNPVFTIVANF